MKKALSTSPDAGSLRRRAEQRLRERQARVEQPPSEADAHALVHELQVHQIELEMQNEELRRAQIEAQETTDKYTELFDFAPVGYFHLAEDAVIREANLAGAALLGLDRSQVISRRFEVFVAPGSLPAFAAFCRGAHASDFKQTCEIKLLARGGGERHVELEGRGSCDQVGRERSLRLTVMDITARKEAEGRFREAREYAEKLIQTANLMIIGLDASGTIQVFNEAAEKTTGYHRAELVDRNWYEVLVPKDRYPSVWAALGRLSAGTLPPVFENPILTKSGDERLISWRSSELRVGDRIVGTMSFGIDVTERKQLEEALRELNEQLEHRVQERTAELRRAMELVQAEQTRFRDALDQLPAYLILLSPDYRVPFANRYFEERFGKSQGRRCFEYLFQRTEPCENCESYQVLNTHAPHHWEWAGPDGRNYDISDFPFTDVDGSPLIMEVGLDITERKQADAALQAASRYTRSLIEVSLDPLVTISPAGKITDVNRATELATGAARAELIGSEFSRYFTEPQRAEAGYQKVLAEGFVQDYPLTIRHADGHTTDVLYNAAVYRNEAGAVQGVFAAARDTTERKRAETELARHREHLEELVRHRSGELAAANAQLQAEVAERTRSAEELRARNEELTRFNRAMVDRELRMIELKKEVNELCVGAGQPPRYRLDFEKEQP